MSTQSPIAVSDAWFTGEDQNLQFTIYDTTNTAVNITGWTIQFKMALLQGGAAALTKSATLTTPASGICTVPVLASDTSALAATVYFYTLSRTDAGNNQVLAYGSAVLQSRPS